MTPQIYPVTYEYSLLLLWYFILLVILSFFLSLYFFIIKYHFSFSVLLCSLPPLFLWAPFFFLLPHSLFLDTALTALFPAWKLSCDGDWRVCVCWHPEYAFHVYVFVNTLGVVDTCHCQVSVSSPLPPFKWPLISLSVSPSRPRALNSLTAAHFTASPPASFLMTLLSNVVSQDPTYPPLFHFVLRKWRHHPHFSKRDSETARHFPGVRAGSFMLTVKSWNCYCLHFLACKRQWWQIKCIFAHCSHMWEQSNIVIWHVMIVNRMFRMSAAITDCLCEFTVSHNLFM